jgi:hypothetical protein
MAAAFVAAAIPASMREMLSHSMPKGSRMKGQMPRGAISMAATATAPSVDAGGVEIVVAQAEYTRDTRAQAANREAHRYPPRPAAASAAFPTLRIFIDHAHN